MAWKPGRRVDTYLLYHFRDNRQCPLPVEIHRVRRAMKILLYIAIPYCFICLAFYLLQARLIFFPSHSVRLTPADMRIAYDDVTLTASDGVKLNAWAVTAKSAAPWIILCHGNGGNIADRLHLVRMFHDLGASLLLFDYRGYGRSEGSPSEEGLYLDVDTAWKYLTEQRHVAPSDIVVWGESLGGGPATWLAANRTVGALVLQSTFTSVDDMGVGLYPWLPIRMLCRNRFASIDRIASIQCRKLFMHSKIDTIVPQRYGKRLYEAAAAPKQWLEISGGHNDGLDQQPLEVRQAIRSFLIPKVTAPG